MNAYRVVKTLETFTVEDDEIVSLTKAAELSGYSISGVMRLVETGKLPEIRLLPRFDEGDRFTLRSAAIKAKRRR